MMPHKDTELQPQEVQLQEVMVLLGLLLVSLLTLAAKAEAVVVVVFRLVVKPDHQDRMDNLVTMEPLDQTERTVHQDNHLHHKEINTVDVKNADKPKQVNQESPDQRDYPERLEHQAELPMEVYEDPQDHQDQSAQQVMPEIQDNLDNQESPELSEQSQEEPDHQDHQDHQDQEDHPEVLEAADSQESQAVKVHQEMLAPQAATENQVEADNLEHKEIKVRAVLAIIVHHHVQPLDINSDDCSTPSSLLLSNLPFLFIFLSSLESTFALGNGSKLQKRTKIL